MEGIGYLNDKFISVEQALIPVYDRGMIFGDGIYEVIRWYGEDFFKANEHFARMKISAEAIGLKIPHVGLLKEIASKLARMNKMQGREARLYIQITRGVARRTHHYPDPPVKPTLFMDISPFKPFVRLLNNGAEAILHEDIRWQRCDIKTTALLPNTMVMQKAKKSGAYEAVFHDGKLITEGTHTNIFAIKNGMISTPPRSNKILAGITRGLVLEFCKKSNYLARERNIMVDELLDADEVFLTGTATEITPVVKIDGNIIGTGRPGVVTRSLLNILNEETRKCKF
ncbi:MAG: aminotransferase class IV [Bacteroidota bacterium]